MLFITQKIPHRHLGDFGQLVVVCGRSTNAKWEKRVNLGREGIDLLLFSPVCSGILRFSAVIGLRRMSASIWRLKKLNRQVDLTKVKA